MRIAFVSAPTIMNSQIIDSDGPHNDTRTPRQVIILFRLLTRERLPKKHGAFLVLSPTWSRHDSRSPQEEEEQWQSQQEQEQQEQLEPPTSTTLVDMDDRIHGNDDCGWFRRISVDPIYVYFGSTLFHFMHHSLGVNSNLYSTRMRKNIRNDTISWWTSIGYQQQKKESTRLSFICCPKTYPMNNAKRNVVPSSVSRAPRIRSLFSTLPKYAFPHTQWHLYQFISVL